MFIVIEKMAWIRGFVAAMTLMTLMTLICERFLDRGCASTS
jgi:hypothetical protein